MVKLVSFLMTLLIGINVAMGAHIIKDKDEAHHVTQQILKRQGVKHKHEDVQNLRDEFHIMKEEAHAFDPLLKDAIDHKKRSRSITDEIKMRNVEATVRGEGIKPAKKAHEVKKNKNLKKGMGGMGGMRK